MFGFFLIFNRTNATTEENNAEIINDTFAYFIGSVGIATIKLVAGIISLTCFNLTAISQASRMRLKYFTSLMRQGIKEKK